MMSLLDECVTTSLLSNWVVADMISLLDGTVVRGVGSVPDNFSVNDIILESFEFLCCGVLLWWETDEVVPALVIDNSVN